MVLAIILGLTLVIVGNLQDVVKAQNENEAQLLQRIQQLEVTIQQLVAQQQQFQDQDRTQVFQDITQVTAWEKADQNPETTQQSTPSTSTQQQSFENVQQISESVSIQKFAEEAFESSSSNQGRKNIQSESAELVDTMKLLQTTSQQDSSSGYGDFDQIIQVMDAATPAQISQFMQVMKITPADVNQEFIAQLVSGDVQKTRNQILNVMNGETDENIFESAQKDQEQSKNGDQEEQALAKAQVESLKSENLESGKDVEMQQDQQQQVEEKVQKLVDNVDQEKYVENQEDSTEQVQEVEISKQFEQLQKDVEKYDTDIAMKELKTKLDKQQEIQDSEFVQEQEQQIAEYGYQESTIKQDTEAFDDEQSVPLDKQENEESEKEQDAKMIEQTPDNQEDTQSMVSPSRDTVKETPLQECNSEFGTCSAPSEEEKEEYTVPQNELQAIIPEMDDLQPQLEKVYQHITKKHFAPELEEEEKEIDGLSDLEDESTDKQPIQTPAFQQLPQDRTNEGRLQLPSKAACMYKMHLFFILSLLVLAALWIV